MGSELFNFRNILSSKAIESSSEKVVQKKFDFFVFMYSVTVSSQGVLVDDTLLHDTL